MLLNAEDCSIRIDIMIGKRFGLVSVLLICIADLISIFPVRAQEINCGAKCSGPNSNLEYNCRQIASNRTDLRECLRRVSDQTAQCFRSCSENNVRIRNQRTAPGKN
jgi:hypothetical protein